MSRTIRNNPLRLAELRRYASRRYLRAHVRQNKTAAELFFGAAEKASRLHGIAVSAQARYLARLRG